MYSLYLLCIFYLLEQLDDLVVAFLSGFGQSGLAINLAFLLLFAHVHVTIESRRLRALVGFDQVRFGLAVSHGAVQTPYLSHREIQDRALLQLAPSQRLPVEIRAPAGSAASL